MRDRRVRRAAILIEAGAKLATMARPKSGPRMQEAERVRTLANR
jgi:hypothetical protein